MELFEEELCEVECEGVRYILRRNPERAKEIAITRSEKMASIERLVQKKNLYLAEHLRAKEDTALAKINNKIERLKLSKWLKVEADGRKLHLEADEDALAKEAKLDGCYVIKSDLPKDVDKRIIHDRYKDLARVEQAFRTSKTVLLEMRPWHVRTEKSTRGHALVVMLAYLVIHYLQQAWVDLDVTVEEGLRRLATICSMEMVAEEQVSCHRVPTPHQALTELLKAADVHLPRVLPSLGARIVSRKKLPSRRKNR